MEILFEMFPDIYCSVYFISGLTDSFIYIYIYVSLSSFLPFFLSFFHAIQ